MHVLSTKPSSELPMIAPVIAGRVANFMPEVRRELPTLSWPTLCPKFGEITNFVDANFVPISSMKVANFVP